MQPDEVEARSGTPGAGPTLVRVRRLRTGRPTDSERQRDVYALYHAGARAAFPHTEHVLETVYLSTNEIDPVSLTAKTAQTRLDHYEQALAGIRAGLFPARPSDRDCPRCPHFFICPVADNGGSAAPEVPTAASRPS